MPLFLCDSVSSVVRGRSAEIRIVKVAFDGEVVGEAVEGDAAEMKGVTHARGRWAAGEGNRVGTEEFRGVIKKKLIHEARSQSGGVDVRAAFDQQTGDFEFPQAR